MPLNGSPQNESTKKPISPPQPPPKPSKSRRPKKSLHCKAAAKKPRVTKDQKVSSVQDRSNELDNTFPTHIEIKDTSSTHYYDIFNLAKKQLITNIELDKRSACVFFNVAIIPISVYTPIRSIACVFTESELQELISNRDNDPQNHSRGSRNISSHIAKTSVTVTQNHFKYFDNINIYNKLYPNDQITPHQLSILFPCLPINKTCQETEDTLNSIQKLTSTELTHPLIAGLDILYFNELNIFEITLYMSYRIQHSPRSDTKYYFSNDLSSIPPNEQLIVSMHEHNLCPIVYTECQIKQIHSQPRILSVFNSLNIPHYFKTISDKLKHSRHNQRDVS